MHKAWSSIEEVPYSFSRSSVKFQGHTALKIVEFDPNWAFPDCNSSLKSPMATKWCTKLEVAYKRCSIVFQGHVSNGKVTRLKKSSILTQIGCFRTVAPAWIQQLQFEFTDGYEMLHKAWNSKGEVPYCFPRSSIKFQVHTGQNITDFDPNWAFPDYRLVAAFKSQICLVIWFQVFCQ